MQALGVQFMNDKKEAITELPVKLTELAFINTDGLDRRISNCELTILCDVENKLLGENGAASVFGPQKGATEGDIKKLDAALATFSKITLAKTGINTSK